MDGLNMKNAFAKVNGKVVYRFNIITTPHWVYTVYEPTDLLKREHSTITSATDFGMKGWLGGMHSRTLPADIDAIPVSPERIRRVHEFHDELDRQITELIHAVFPETAGHKAERGEIEMTHGEPAERTNKEEIIVTHEHAS
jgi:hypothetical protein